MGFDLRRAPALLLCLLSLAPAIAGAVAFPEWAYPGCPARAERAAKDEAEPVTVPGSARTVTRGQIHDASVTVDWFPEEHAPMPPIVARQPGKAGCGYCHLADGAGRPENAKLAGLPAAYIVAQVHALHSGERGSAAPDWEPTAYMQQVTVDLDADVIAAAARYYESAKARSHLRVVERASVPASVTRCYMNARVDGPPARLGARILELPDDFARFELRDPHTEYTAYVPPGSIARGRKLASGGARVPACASCHGAGLTGDGALPGPPLAGRFPGYLFRQLYAFRSGARHGEAAAPMGAVAAALSDAEMIDLAAYAATLPP